MHHLSQHAIKRMAVERVAEFEVFVENCIGFVATELVKAGRMD
jgi:hypothetical protein